MELASTRNALDRADFSAVETDYLDIATITPGYYWVDVMDYSGKVEKANVMAEVTGEIPFLSVRVPDFVSPSRVRFVCSVLAPDRSLTTPYVGSTRRGME